jgi:hypothetical protein
MRFVPVAVLLAVLFGAPSAVIGGGVRSYGWFDMGGLIVVPAHASRNESGGGIALSSGVQFLEYIQTGGRLRLAITSDRICGPTPSGTGSCSEASAPMISLGLELRVRVPVSSRWALALGGSLSVGAWAAFSGHDSGGGAGGKNLAADLRVVYLPGETPGRYGIHVAFEQQEQFDTESGVDRLAISAFWAGVDW